MFAAAFAAFGVVAVVRGAVAGQAAPVVFGVLWLAAFGFTAWGGAHLASRLEFAGGCLSWRCSEAEPAIVVDVRLRGRARKWMKTEPPGYIRRRIRSAGDNRGVRVLFSIAVSLVLLGAAAEVGLVLTGPQENFQTLRGDLAAVHLPAGYRLTATRQAGSDCAAGPCSLTQTWAWAPSSAPTISAACTELDNSLTSAFPRVGANSPMPAGAACDYYAVLSDPLRPGQGKRTVEAMVRAGQAGINDDFLIVLTASYG